MTMQEPTFFILTARQTAVERMRSDATGATTRLQEAFSVAVQHG
ncbi:hypothetical protein [Catellatospora sichuanensis]|nr:hypothetical protein [Catellatospora sichuanensis]